MMGIKKWVYRLMYRLTEPDFDKNANVRFIHAQPDFGNLGDTLCSPKNYFNFRAKQCINIIGGGANSSLGVHQLNFLKLNPKRTILWGVGQTLPETIKPKYIKSLPFIFWGLRDVDSVDSDHFLPCVSCMHPMLRMPINKNGLLIYLNYDEEITNSIIKDKVSNVLDDEISILYNNCKEQDFINALTDTDKIITNSFHGAYWGLLSGRSVTLIGYSSKFYSLYDLFELDKNKIIRVKRGNSDDLITAINKSQSGCYYVELENFEEWRSKLIEITLEFIDELRYSGLFYNVTPRLI